MQWHAAGVAAAAVVEVAAACGAAVEAAECLAVVEVAVTAAAGVTAAEPVAVEGTTARHPCRGRRVAPRRCLERPTGPVRDPGTATFPRPAVGPVLVLAPMWALAPA